jgi:hypothetical protein
MSQASEALERIAGLGSSIQDFSDAVMEEFGGPLGLAKEVRLEYRAMDRGNPGKARILTLVLEIFKEFGATMGPEEYDLSALEAEEAALAGLEGEDDEEW